MNYTTSDPTKNGKDGNVIHRSLRGKLIITMIFACLFVMGVTISVVEMQMRDSILQEFIARGKTIAANLAAVNANYVATYNYVGMEQSIAEVVKSNDLSYAAIQLFDGELVAAQGEKRLWPMVFNGDVNERAVSAETSTSQFFQWKEHAEDYCDIAVPILVGNEKWATARVGLSLFGMQKAISSTRTTLILLGAIVIFFSILGVLIVSRQITRPISQLVQSVDAVAEGNFDTVISISSTDEIGYLGKRFSNMKDTLKQNITMLRDTNKELEKSNSNLQRLSSAAGHILKLRDAEGLYDMILDIAMEAAESPLAHIVQSDGLRTNIIATKQTDDFDLALHKADLLFNTNAFDADAETSLSSPGCCEGTQCDLSNSKRNCVVMSNSAHPDFELIRLPLGNFSTAKAFVHLLRDKSDGTLEESRINALTALTGQASSALESFTLFVQLEEAYLSSVKSLAKSLEFKDQYTHGHSERVAEVSQMIAMRMSMPEDKIKTLYNAALLHDIGKIGVLESIINKQSRLSNDEYAEMKRHPIIGDEILAPIGSLHMERTIVRHHHERYDGKGYPDGLTGDMLSLSERIIIVADAFDAMNSKRSYRDPMPPEIIRQEIINNSGSQFDPEVVDAFMSIFDNAVQRGREDMLLRSETLSRIVMYQDVETAHNGGQ